jgi:hypothetical protein
MLLFALYSAQLTFSPGLPCCLQDEKMLLEQLTQAFEKGSWLVFSDPDKPMYHKSLQEFQQHVRRSYLVSAAVLGLSEIFLAYCCQPALCM